MTAALGLIRLHLNGHDIERDYQTALRSWLDGRNGLLPAQRGRHATSAGPRTDADDRLPASLRH